MAERQVPPIRFPASRAAEITDAHREISDRAYDAQAADDLRFSAAADALLARLDLVERPLTAMTCDHRFSLLLENWVASCDHAEIDIRSSTLVFPTDAQAHERAESLGLVSYFDEQSSHLGSLTESGRYGDAAWTGYMFHQNWVIKTLLELGVDALFQDVDLVWHHDPRPHLFAQARAGADIQAMYDGPNPRYQPHYVNSGFMYFRNAPVVRDFWAEVYARHDMIAYYQSQQMPLNVMLSVFAQRGLALQVLDEERFANGHLYCGSRVAPDDPWVVHNSWTPDLAEKLRRYEAFDLWFLPVGSLDG